MVFNQSNVYVWYASPEQYPPTRSCTLTKCYCNFFFVPSVFVDCVVIQFRVIQFSILYFCNRSVLLAPIAGNICPIEDDPTDIGIDIALQFVSIPLSSNTFIMTAIENVFNLFISGSCNY